MTTLNEEKAKLFESSLGRLWYHIKDAEHKSFSIMTSWRASNSRKENKANFALLKTKIRALGHGFVEVKGHWRECQDLDASYETCPEDQLVDVLEPSIFVIGISKQEADSLGKEYKQDAIVFAGPETKGRIMLFLKDGTEIDIGAFKPQTLGQAFTELRKSQQGAKRYFKFEGFEYKAQSFIETLVEVELQKVRK